MCEAFTVATLVATAATAAVSAYSQNQAGQAKADAASANASGESIKAQYAEATAAGEAGRARAQGTAVISEQKVATAAGGVDIGSAGNVFATTRALSEQDARQAKVNGALEAWGHRAQAQADEVEARVARRNSVLGPLGTLLGAGASMGAQGASYYRSLPKKGA